jgi:hypothetical protein
MAVVLGGWAIIAEQSQAVGAGVEPPVFAPLPTLAAPPAAAGTDGQAAPRPAAPSGLRSVAAPPPVAVTRSSR